MNHANWNSPAEHHQFHVREVTSFSSPRLIQMAMKLYF